MSVDEDTAQAKLFTSMDRLVHLKGAFCSHFRDLAVSKDACIYSIPSQLIHSLMDAVPKFFEPRDLEYERELIAELEGFGAIGLSAYGVIRCHLFEQPPKPFVSKADFDELGWSEAGIAYEGINEAIAEGVSNARQFDTQIKAYLGWLTTNPSYLHDVSLLREEVQSIGPTGDSLEVLLLRENVKSFRELCAKWQIGGLFSWELPRPQTINLGGPPVSLSMGDCGESVVLQLPPTLRIPARLPIQKALKCAGKQITGDNLAEWQSIVNQRGRSKFGSERFVDIFNVHFYRNVVLKSRYSVKFPGNIEAIDLAVGSFLGKGVDSIKSVRLAIDRRLVQA